MQSISHSDELFRRALEAAPTGMLLMDRAGRITLVNVQVERLFGYSRTELVGQHLEVLVPERYRAAHSVFRDEFLRSPQTRAMGVGRELFGLRRDGSELPVEIGLTPMSTSEGSFVLASIVDITERQRAVEELRERSRELAASVHERDLLLQEVHHRVKNNLQLMTSLINIQARQLAPGEARMALDECRRRVDAISLIHEKLYESHNYAEVPFSDYIRTLATNLLRASERTAQIELTCECDAITLPVGRAISCGLLLNEIITQQLHPRAALDVESLFIGMRREPSGDIHLRVESRPDPHAPTGNAPGMQPDLGLQLADMLAAQLNGSLQIHASCSATVTFPA